MIKSYNKPILKIKKNGWISKSCVMEKGILQGCPISALLFIFVIDIKSKFYAAKASWINRTKKALHINRLIPS